MDAYEVLGLSHDADAQDLRSAYRTLAARWHPDRFPEGPERDWATEKMMQINRAYHELAGKPQDIIRGGVDTERLLREIRDLTDKGHANAARTLLKQIRERPAEWNYLFARVLLLSGDREKAKIYLRIAVKQCPENEEYRELLAETEGRRSLLQKIKTHIGR